MSITLPKIFKHFYSKVELKNNIKDYIYTIKKATNIKNIDKFDFITNKILFTNNFFWEYIDNNFLTGEFQMLSSEINNEIISELINFVEDLYKLYTKCRINDFNSNLRPIDKRTNSEISIGDDMEVSDEGECFSIKKIINNIVDDYSSLNNEGKKELGDAFIENVNNIANSNLSDIEKKEKTALLIDEPIKRGWLSPTSKKVLMYTTLAAILGVGSYYGYQYKDQIISNIESVNLPNFDKYYVMITELINKIKFETDKIKQMELINNLFNLIKQAFQNVKSQTDKIKILELLKDIPYLKSLLTYFSFTA